MIGTFKNSCGVTKSEAAQNTVKEAGDGTTTATVLAHAILKLASETPEDLSIRDLKIGLDLGYSKIIEYLDSVKIPVKKSMLEQVATISCNNDEVLGKQIGNAFKKVGKDGIVLMEESETNETYVDFVEGVQFDSGLKSPHLVTDKDKNIAVLDNPYVLIVSSPIPNIRRIQNILEHVIKSKRSFQSFECLKKLLRVFNASSTEYNWVSAIVMDLLLLNVIISP